MLFSEMHPQPLLGETTDALDISKYHSIKKSGWKGDKTRIRQDSLETFLSSGKQYFLTLEGDSGQLSHLTPCSCVPR